VTFIDAGVSAVGRLRRGLARMTNLAGSDPTSNLANSAAPLVELNGREHVGDIRREATLARWKATVDAGEAGLAEHSDTVAKILAAAHERDAISDARDAAAEERRRELDLAEMLDVDGTYGDHWAEQREAGLDRLHAKDDRTASREDRTALTRVQAEHAP
jgi:hypothetical protein